MIEEASTQIAPMRFDIYLKADAPDFALARRVLFRLLHESALSPVFGEGYAKDWWFCQGILPDLALLKRGLAHWADCNSAIFRVLTPDSPAFPPELELSDD